MKRKNQKIAATVYGITLLAVAYLYAVNPKMDYIQFIGLFALAGLITNIVALISKPERSARNTRVAGGLVMISLSVVFLITISTSPQYVPFMIWVMYLLPLLLFIYGIKTLVDASR